MKKQKNKKILALLLTVCMIVSLFDGFSLTVRAADVAAAATYYVGGEFASDENSGLSSNLPFATVAKAAGVINSLGAGNYNIIVQGGTNEGQPVVIGDGSNAINVTITSSCTSTQMTMVTSGSAIVAAATGSAIIKRNAGNSNDMIQVMDAATLNLGDSTGTTVTQLFLDGGNYATTNGSIIRVSSTGVLNLYSNVTLQNNYISKSDSGGGIYNYGTFSMYGGTIKDNLAYFGGGVNNRYVMNLYGGTITSNSSLYMGGGIFSQGSNITMTGGTISENDSSDWGGGIYSINNISMSGGVIENNSAKVSGGALFSAHSTVKLSGSASIPTGSSQSNDVLMYDSAFEIIEGLTSKENILITNGKVDGGSTLLEGATILKGNADLINAYRSLFILSDSRYVINSEGKLDYTAMPVTYYVGGSGANDSNDGISLATPLASLEKAVDLNNGGKCTIIVQDNLTLNSVLYTNGDVTIVGDGGTPHTITVSPDYSDSYLFCVYSGSLNLGNANNTDAPDTLTFDGNNKTVDNAARVEAGTLNLYSGVVLQKIIAGDALLYNINGTINMAGGTIRNCTARDIVYNRNTFNLSGGTITDNTTSMGVVNNYGTLNMSGGFITKNSSYGILNHGSVTMSGGRVTENAKEGISNSSTFVIADTAYIADILLCNVTDTVTIGGNLSNTTPMTITGYKYIHGGAVLSGTSKRIKDNYNKFQMTSSSNYELKDDGTIKYSLPEEVYYVNEATGDDTNNTGAIKSPYKTMQKAVSQILVSEVGRIILQSDIDLAERIKIDGNITVISDGKVRTIKRNAALLESMFKVNGKLALGNEDGSGDDENPTLIIDGGKTAGITADNEMIYNVSLLELYKGVALQNNNASEEDNAGAVYNENIFRMNGGIIRNNSSTEVGGVYVDSDAQMIMNGGTMSNNTGNVGGIWISRGSFTMNGGKIINNSSSTTTKGMGTGAIAAENCESFIMNGGTISGNTGLVGGILFMNNGLVAKAAIKPIVEHESVIAMNGGTISNNVGSVLSGIFMYGSGDFIMSGSAVIADKDKITFDNTSKGVVKIAGKLTGADTVATIDVVSFDISAKDFASALKHVIPMGRQILASANGYSFTEADAAKFAFTNSEYGINAQGKIDVNKKDSKDPIIPSSGATVPTNDLVIDMTKEDFTKSADGIKIPVLTQKTFEQYMKGDSAAVNVTVKLPDSVLNKGNSDTKLVLEAAVIEAVKKSDKNLTVSVKDEEKRERYSWTFKNEELKDSGKDIKDINLYLEVREIKDDSGLMKNLKEKDAKGLIVSFGHEGDLPAQASVRIYAGDIEGITPGSQVFLYHYNHETNKLESLPFSSNYVVDKDGYITVNIVHCSDYVALAKKAPSSLVTSLSSQIEVASTKKILYVGKEKSSFATIKITLPSTLEFVSSLKDSTSQSAIGGVTVTYSSSDKKVATVNKNGKITAKGAGKAKITTKITLYNGKSKIVKTIITVK